MAYFMKWLAYGWLAFAVVGLIWAFGFLWWRSDFAGSVDRFSWTILLSAFGPVVGLLLLAAWIERKAKAKPAPDTPPHSA
jgi:hypothetical protein